MRFTASFPGCSFVATVCFTLRIGTFLQLPRTKCFQLPLDRLRGYMDGGCFSEEKFQPAISSSLSMFWNYSFQLNLFFNVYIFLFLVKPSVEIAPVSLPKNRFRLGFTFCKALPATAFKIWFAYLLALLRFQQVYRVFSFKPCFGAKPRLRISASIGIKCYCHFIVWYLHTAQPIQVRISPSFSFRKICIAVHEWTRFGRFDLLLYKFRVAPSLHI